MDMEAVITIIERRRARFDTQRSSGSQGGMDQSAGLMAEEYDALLAEIAAVAVANRPEAERKNREAEAEILGDQGQSGG